MTPRFYGVYLSDEALYYGLTALRFTLEPDAVRFSHLTLRGPYERGLNSDQLAQLNASVSDWSIQLVEVGTFFGANQNTVYLRCELGDLGKLWNKPQFPRGLPHLTLYDGGDRDIAKSLVQLLKHWRFSGRARVSMLRPVDEKSILRTTLAGTLPEFETFRASLLGSKAIPAQELATLATHRRLELVNQTLVQLSSRSTLIRPLGEKATRNTREWLDTAKHIGAQSFLPL